jgi:hypothetical protein
MFVIALRQLSDDCCDGDASSIALFIEVVARWTLSESIASKNVPSKSVSSTRCPDLSFAETNRFVELDHGYLRRTCGSRFDADMQIAIMRTAGSLSPTLRASRPQFRRVRALQR